MGEKEYIIVKAEIIYNNKVYSDEKIISVNEVKESTLKPKYYIRDIIDEMTEDLVENFVHEEDPTGYYTP